MTHPKLSVPSSGLGGRGYKQIFGDGTPVPSITTALGALEKPGIVNWHIENTVYYAVRNIDDLLSRTEEAGERYLSYYTRRLKERDLDDPEINALNFSMGVLDDLSNLGNFIHDYVECDLQGWFTPEPWRDDQVEMIEAYHEWKEQHEVEVICTETTVFGNGYAGTLDIIAKVDGTPLLIDTKSSRKVYDSHIAQLSALGSAHSMAVEVSEGTEGAVPYKMVPSVSKEHGGQVDSWWVEEPLPAFQGYAVLQIRPGDVDTKGKYLAPFCELHRIDQRLIDTGMGIFQAGLDARVAQRKFAQIEKEIEKEMF